MPSLLHHNGMTPVTTMDIRRIIESHASKDRAKELLVALVKVPSPQTELLEAEPRLREFITGALEPRLRQMGFGAIRYDDMGNLIATFGADATGKSLMFVGHAMNQPAATMANAYDGDVVDGAPFDLPGEAVMGKGASEQKSTLAAMLHGMETVIGAGLPINGRLVFVCCVSGETGRHDAIRNVVETEGVRADMALLYGDSLMINLGNRGRIDVFIRVHGAPCHSSQPQEGCNAITGAMEVIRRLGDDVPLDASHPDLGTPTLCINRLKSFPESTHTIQARCDITVDRRLLPGEDPKAALADIEAAAMAVDGMADPVSGKKWRVEVEMGPFMYPSLLTADSPIVRLINRAGEAMLGAAPETFFAPSAFDQGYLNHVGIPTANYGAGEQRFAHTDQDMASVDRTFDSAKVYAYMIADYLG